MKKIISLLLSGCVLATSLFGLTACNTKDIGTGWKTKFDISKPNFENVGTSEATANKDGWYSTRLWEFTDGLPSEWSPIENCERKENEEFWCDQMISYDTINGHVVIDAKTNTTEHIHPNPNYDPTKDDESKKYFPCHGKVNRNFTSGIITCDTTSGDRKTRTPLFTQAFGYFEARVKIPDSDGMWSAFWLQTDSIRQLGNGGKDGAEIDIYESSFYRDRSKVGNCIHYNGYGNEHRSRQAVHDVGYDLYDDWHTFSLKWTPEEYVFFCDGKPVWATNAGGVCQVPAYIMLTCEQRHEGVYGPYGQKLGKFTGGEFLIDYVHVYQNKNYTPFEKKASDFK